MAKSKTKKEKTKKSTKSHKKMYITIAIIAVLIVGGFVGYKIITKEDTPKKVIVVKEIDNLKDYGYKLTDLDSKYYKDEFAILKEIVNAKEFDEEKYVNQIAKMFVIDLYSMSTKSNKYDIGGIEYFHKNKQDMFERKVRDTIYQTMEDNTYGDRKQKLPEVKDATIAETTQMEYKLGEKKVPAYLVKLTITYVESMGYDDEASVVLVQESDKKWSVVDYQPTLKPKYSK